MKKIITILILTLSFAGLYAQAPAKTSYQAVVRDATGKLVALKPVGVRISILQGSEFGAATYVETHTATTNTNGLLTINIGAGTEVLGFYFDINWSKGPYFLKTEIDPLGGTSYSITGTQQLMSVPYAFFSDRSNSSLWTDTSGYAWTAGKAIVADSLNQDSKIFTQQIRGEGALTDQYLRWDGNYWTPTSIPQLKAGNGIGIDNNGKIGTPWSSGPNGPYTDSLYVSIGTKIPYGRLTVSGAGNVSATIFQGSSWNSFYRYNRYLGYIGSWSDTNALDFGTNNTGIGTNIVTDGTPRISVKAGTGYVGINTTTPGNTLDVNGGTTTQTLNVTGLTTTQSLRVTNGAGTGKVMTSDASGNAVWTTPGKQIVGVYPANGYLGGPYVSQTGYAFIGPTVSITITSTGDIITGSFQVPLSTSTGIATGCRFGLGYQLGAGTITNFTGNSYSAMSIGTERHTQAATASVTGLPAGTYTVGVVLYNSSAVSINSNDYSNGYFMLIR